MQENEILHEYRLTKSKFSIVNKGRTMQTCRVEYITDGITSKGVILHEKTNRKCRPTRCFVSGFISEKIEFEHSPYTTRSDNL